MLGALGVRLHAEGFEHVVPAARGALLVANHVSWLDILAIDAVCPSRFVSKSEVRRWPLVGWLASCAGTLFLQRGHRRAAVRLAQDIALALEPPSRDVIAVFPEGTVGDGRRLLPFHASLFQAAIDARVSVLPVAIRYVDAAKAHGSHSAGGPPRGLQPSAIVHYHGKVTIGQSIRRILGARGLAVHLVALPPIAFAADADRRTLADAARSQVGQQLDAMGAAG